MHIATPAISGPVPAQSGLAEEPAVGAALLGRSAKGRFGSLSRPKAGRSRNWPWGAVLSRRRAIGRLSSRRRARKEHAHRHSGPKRAGPGPKRAGRGTGRWCGPFREQRQRSVWLAVPAQSGPVEELVVGCGPFKASRHRSVKLAAACAQRACHSGPKRAGPGPKRAGRGTGRWGDPSRGAPTVGLARCPGPKRAGRGIGRGVRSFQGVAP